MVLMTIGSCKFDRECESSVTKLASLNNKKILSLQDKPKDKEGQITNSTSVIEKMDIVRNYKVWVKVDVLEIPIGYFISIC